MPRSMNNYRKWVTNIFGDGDVLIPYVDYVLKESIDS